MIDTPPLTSGQTIRILGIDPGSVTTGVGVIDSDGRQHKLVFYGVIRVGGGGMPQRINTIFNDVTEVINTYHPNEMAIEEVFLGKSPMAAIKLGQARGAAICAGVQKDLPVGEYAARVVKKFVVGTGDATKEQMEMMVKNMMSLDIDKIQADAADALGIALCHAHARTLTVPMHLHENRRRKSSRFRL